MHPGKVSRGEMRKLIPREPTAAKKGFFHKFNLSTRNDPAKSRLVSGKL
jgi:hypothetical protein